MKSRFLNQIIRLIQIINMLNYNYIKLSNYVLYVLK